MDQRIVEFIAGLRAAGVRVSLAESADAFRATEQVGILERETFQAALKTTLIKDAEDAPTFDKLFPLYFGGDGPPLVNPEYEISSDDLEKLAEAIQQISADPEALRQLLGYIMRGQTPTRAELERLGNAIGLSLARHPYQQQWLTERMMRMLGFQKLQEALRELFQKLTEMGLTREALEKLAQIARANAEILREQISNYVRAQIARNMQAQPRERQVFRGPDLMHRAFNALSERDLAELRGQIRRLASQLRTRVALRQKRGKRGMLDAKRTIRANLRFASVPLDLKHKVRHLKPRLVLICDVSTSVRPVVEFMLRLVYELQDQISKTRSFVFIDDLKDISMEFAAHRPERAVERVLEQNPPGYYSTNLGYSLHTFTHDFLDSLDHRTTVIILGDARNNYLDPNLGAFQEIKKRARKIIWFNPEHPRLWGTGDSDMYAYLPHCDAVHPVSNLAQLAEAIDNLFER